jgi:hypothetical protein
MTPPKSKASAPEGGSRQRRARRIVAPPAPIPDRSPREFLWLPFALTVGLLLLSFVERVQSNAVLVWSFWGSAAVLLAWQAWFFHRHRDGEWQGPVFTKLLRPQHYIQAALQLAVYAYWGYYWSPVYDYAWLLLAQLVFAYAFSMLLAWSRKQPYQLGFGAFPIILSTNLFLWFRDDWFYLQFLMIAVGFLGKEFVRWNREGRRVHIFNPSAFSLGLFSLVLIATGATELTRGVEIATTLSIGPNIYMLLFLIGLVAMFSFSITLVTGLAALVLFGWSAAYGAVTGVPYFVDSEIPAAVFLGLHLLVTDPSTSPRTALGKAFFGLMYGASVVILFAVLGALGAPTFYDKLLAVPLLNLSVQWIDRTAHRVRETEWWRNVTPAWTPGRLNLAQMGVWSIFFLVMTGMGRTDGRHPGDTLPFWQQACAEGRTGACDRLLQIQYSYCADNAGWACNELGRHLRQGQIIDRDPVLARGYFARACEGRFQAGCMNLLDPEGLAEARPRPIDLRVMLREGGANLSETPEPELYARACEHGWEFACGTIASRAP